MMCLTKLLSFSILIILASAESQALDFTARSAQMRSVCMDRDWSQVTCNISAAMKNGTGYKSNALDRTADFLAGDIMFQGVSSAKRIADLYLMGENRSTVTREQDTMLAEIKAELQVFAEQNNLTDCARACLATCASSQLITFNIDTALAPEYNPAYILYKGEGLCRHFSGLADSLMDALGIPSLTVGGSLYEDGENVGGHAWISVKLDGKRLWMEPQDSECNFYNPKLSIF